MGTILEVNKIKVWKLLNFTDIYWRTPSVTIQYRSWSSQTEQWQINGNSNKEGEEQIKIKQTFGNGAITHTFIGVLPLQQKNTEVGRFHD